MTWTEKDIEWVDNHLRSAQAAGAEPDIEKDLEHDSGKKDALETIQLLKGASRLQEMERQLEMLKEHDKIMGQGRGRVRMMYIVAAAASVLVLLGVTLWLWPTIGADNTQYYVAENFETEYIMHDVDRSVEEKTRDFARQQRAYNLYALQRFDEAIPLLEEQWLQTEDNLSLFYLIISYSATGDRQKASDIFQRNRDVLTARQAELIESVLR